MVDTKEIKEKEVPVLVSRAMKRRAAAESEMMEKEAKGETWYSYSGVGYKYFSPFAAKKTIFFTLEDIDNPTPHQIAEQLNKGYEFDKELKIFSKRARGSHKTSMALPEGVYQHSMVKGLGDILTPMTLREDDNIAPLKNATSDMKVMLDNFLEKEDVYKQHNLAYRLGIFAYGPAGSGKSLSLRRFLNEAVKERDAVVIYMDRNLPTNAFLETLKRSCKDRLKIFVFEEFTEFLNDPFLKQDKLLSFLDGELSLDKSVTVATTNFPDKIPNNIKNRPGRFDKQLLFSNPMAKDREILIHHFLDRDVTEMEIEKSKGLSVAAIRECCIDVLIRDKDFLDSVQECKKRMTDVKGFNPAAV